MKFSCCGSPRRSRRRAGLEWMWVGCLLLGACSGADSTRDAARPAETIAAPTTGRVTAAGTYVAVTPAQALGTAALPTRPRPSPTPTQFRLPSPTPSLTPTAASIGLTATPACEDGLIFLSDLTIPDGTIVTPGAAIDKRWRIQNNGTCNWDERYRLQLITGTGLGLPDEMALYPARSGVQTVVRMLLQAPPEPGTFRSAWQAINPANEAFGDPIFIEIIVAATAPTP